MGKHRGDTVQRPEMLHGALLIASTIGWCAALVTLAVCCWQVLKHAIHRQRGMRRQVHLELSDARAESTACNNTWDVQLNEAAMKAWAIAAARAEERRPAAAAQGELEGAATAQNGPGGCSAGDRIQA